MSEHTPQGQPPLYTDSRLIAEAEGIAAGWHTVLDGEQIYLLRCQVLGLTRRVEASRETERATLHARIAELEAQVAAGDEIARGKTELENLQVAAAAALGWIDEIYPADIFDGSSGDEGPLRIMEIRENLRQRLAGVEVAAGEWEPLVEFAVSGTHYIRRWRRQFQPRYLVNLARKFAEDMTAEGTSDGNR